MIDEEELKEKLRKILPEVLEEGLGENTYYLTNDKLHLSASTPKTQLEGAETDGKNLSLRENAGVLEVYDEASGAKIGSISPDFYTKADTPKLHVEGTETDAGTYSIREDAGKIIIRDEVGAADVAQIDIATGNVELLGDYTIDPTVNKDTPAVTLAGTETGAKTLSLKESAGVAQVYDEGAGARVSLPLSETPPDLPQSGLAADATGVKWTSVQKLKIDPSRVKSVTLRATWAATDTDSVTAIEVYDETATSVLGSVSGNTGTNSEGAISGFTAGNIVTLRANVTTLSATTGATTDVDYCLLELDLEI